MKSSNESSSSPSSFPVVFSGVPDGLTEEECQSIWESRNEYDAERRGRQMQQHMDDTNRGRGDRISREDGVYDDDSAASTELAGSHHNMTNEENDLTHRYLESTGWSAKERAESIVSRFPELNLQHEAQQTQRLTGGRLGTFESQRLPHSRNDVIGNAGISSLPTSSRTDLSTNTSSAHDAQFREYNRLQQAHIQHLSSQSNHAVGTQEMSSQSTKELQLSESSLLHHDRIQQIMQDRTQLSQSQMNLDSDYAPGTSSPSLSSLDIVVGMANLSTNAYSCGVSSLAHAAHVREYNRLHQAHIQRSQSQTNQKMRSQTESSRAFDIAHSFRNTPLSAHEAQVREYERLHQAHIQRLQSQNNQTSTDRGATFDGMDHLPSNAAARSYRRDTNESISNHAFGGLDLSSNHTFAHDAQVSHSNTLHQAGLGRLTTMGNAIGSSDGKQDGVKPPPDQCHSLAVPNQTEHHTKPVKCEVCNSHLYTAPSTTTYSCQICGRASSI